MNLIMAGIWVAVGVGLLIYGQLPEGRRFTIWGTDISVAWVAFVGAAFNLVRWWGIRSVRAEREAYREMRKQMEEKWASRHRAEPPPEPDPTFDFTRDPPPPDRHLGPPPSEN